MLSVGNERVNMMPVGLRLLPPEGEEHNCGFTPIPFHSHRDATTSQLRQHDNRVILFLLYFPLCVYIFD